MVTLVHDDWEAVQPAILVNQRQLHRIRKHGGLLLPDDDALVKLAIRVVNQSPLDGRFHPYKIGGRRLYIPSSFEVDEINEILVEQLMAE
jgi:hypothetical protein